MTLGRVLTSNEIEIHYVCVHRYSNLWSRLLIIISKARGIVIFSMPCLIICNLLCICVHRQLDSPAPLSRLIELCTKRKDAGILIEIFLELYKSRYTDKNKHRENTVLDSLKKVFKCYSIFHVLARMLKFSH